ncbi:MAG: hypothetical protein P1U42_03165 [Phycisphaerales bacterium]|nr:hypothetical protein [Phycisphaerales bacterium]
MNHYTAYRLTEFDIARYSKRFLLPQQLYSSIGALVDMIPCKSMKLD